MYTADQFRPTKHDGVAYKARRDGGMLVMYGSVRVCIFVTGPNEMPWASEKTKEKPRWTRTRGNNILDIGLMLRRIERHESNVRNAAAKGKTVTEPARVKAYSSFLAHIEPAHLNEIRDVPLRAFNYYSAIRRCPGLLDLACSGQRRGDLAGSSALAYALSNIALLAEPRPSRPLDKVRRRRQPIQTPVTEYHAGSRSWHHGAADTDSRRPHRSSIPLARRNARRTCRVGLLRAAARIRTLAKNTRREGRLERMRLPVVEVMPLRLSCRANSVEFSARSPGC